MDNEEINIKEVSHPFYTIGSLLEFAKDLCFVLCVSFLVIVIHTFIAHGVFAVGLAATALVFGLITIVISSKINSLYETNKGTILERITNLEKAIS